MIKVFILSPYTHIVIVYTAHDKYVCIHIGQESFEFINFLSRVSVYVLYFSCIIIVCTVECLLYKKKNDSNMTEV